MRITRNAWRVRISLSVLLTGLILAVPAREVPALTVGQSAPEFQLPGSGGAIVTLSDLTAKGPVVLYTFIQAFTGT